LEYSNVFPTSSEVGSVSPGKLMLFQYSAKYAKSLPFYDRNPLCYIVADEGRAFYGVNLHYTQPENRQPILRYIDAGGDFTKLSGYNKYLRSYVKGTFIDLSLNDMEKAIEMRLEDFVRSLDGVNVSYDPNLPSFYK
tara:strand:+ start:193 stop:603 length:411 start_codon:yes stop_codon:yes gene_type:complete